MWVLKPGMDDQLYELLKRGTEENRDAALKQIRERAKGELRRLYLEYHEEVPGEKGSEPTYPLRG